VTLIDKLKQNDSLALKKNQNKLKTCLSSALRAFMLEVTSHNLTIQSADPEASNVPSQLKPQKNYHNSVAFEIIYQLRNSSSIIVV
jgi:hypothetical protein